MHVTCDMQLPKAKVVTQYRRQSASLSKHDKGAYKLLPSWQIRAISHWCPDSFSEAVSSGMHTALRYGAPKPCGQADPVCRHERFQFAITMLRNLSSAFLRPHQANINAATHVFGACTQSSTSSRCICVCLAYACTSSSTTKPHRLHHHSFMCAQTT